MRYATIPRSDLKSASDLRWETTEPHRIGGYQSIEIGILSAAPPTQLWLQPYLALNRQDVRLSVGLPAACAARPAVSLWVGASIIDPPLQTAFGDWFLLPPFFQFPLIPMPATGHEVLFAVVPDNIPTPIAVPMQSMMQFQMTNLEVLRVK